MKLEGKVAAVTGASSGIGAATARSLAQAGAAVVLGARRGDRIEALAGEITATGARATALTVDVSDEGQARGFVEAAHEQMGGLDILVNNAGVMLLGPVTGADLGEWRRMIDVNVYGVLFCTHAALPLMGAAGGGHIVNVSSVAGRRASMGAAVYNLTKWGLNGFSEGLRQEALHANIRVTLIEPGMVETELLEQNTNPVVLDAAERMNREIGQPLSAEDIAEAILYAVSQPSHVSVNEILVRPTGQRA